MSKCVGCPVAVGVCIAEAPVWEFVCKMAEGTDVERQWVVDRSAMAAGEPVSAPMHETPPAYPPLATQAGNLAKAVVKFVGSGLQIVDQAEFDRRHGICQTCEQFDAQQDRCRSCGCSMAVKPWGQAMDCPLGKWEPSAEQGVERNHAQDIH